MTPQQIKDKAEALYARISDNSVGPLYVELCGILELVIELAKQRDTPPSPQPIPPSIRR